MYRCSWRHRSFRNPFSGNHDKQLFDNTHWPLGTLFSHFSPVLPIHYVRYPCHCSKKLGFSGWSWGSHWTHLKLWVRIYLLWKSCLYASSHLRTFTDLSVFPRIIIAPGSHTSCNPIKHVVMRLLGISYLFKLFDEPALSRVSCFMIVVLIGCDCAAFPWNVAPALFAFYCSSSSLNFSSAPVLHHFISG